MPDGPASPEVSLPIPQFEFVDPQEAQIKIRHQGYKVRPPDREFTNFETVYSNLLIEYIQSPIITDCFADKYTPESGSQREIWLDKQSEETRDLLKQNRIRRLKVGNAATGMLGFLQSSHQELHQFHTDPDLTQRITNLGDYILVFNGKNEEGKPAPSRYPNKKYFELTVDEKLKIVRETDDIVIEFLQQNGFEITPIIEFVDPQEAQLTQLDAGFTVNPQKAPVGPYSSIFNLNIRYLEGHLSTDIFKPNEHLTKRRPWQRKQPEKTTNYLIQNRIGLSKIGQVISALSTIFDLEQDLGEQTGILMDTDTKAEAVRLIDYFNSIKNKPYISKFTFQIVDGQEQVIESEVITEEEKKLLEDQLGLCSIKDKKWIETHKADDPNQGYDLLSLDQKLELVRRVDNIAITFLQQNGFTVTPRPPSPSPS